MNFSDRDLAAFRKDIERIRAHEENRPAKVPDESSDPANEPTEHSSPRADPQKSSSLLTRLRDLCEALLELPEPSKEGLEAVPEYVVTLLQVIQEQPKFERWILSLEALPPLPRDQMLAKMAYAFRVEDGASAVADGFDRLRNQHLFRAFCQFLRSPER